MDDPSAHTPRPSRTTRPTNPEALTPDRPDGDEVQAEGSTRIDLSGLTVAGITRRRVGWAAAAFVAIWVVVVFARQVGDAQAATNRATQLADDNAALAGEVAALQKERDLIVEPRYVAQEARGHQLGAPKEIAFSLDPSVTAPIDGAPGSASARLGAITDRQTPLESWLSLLFGPTD